MITHDRYQTAVYAGLLDLWTVSITEAVADVGDPSVPVVASVSTLGPKHGIATSRGPKSALANKLGPISGSASRP